MIRHRPVLHAMPGESLAVRLLSGWEPYRWRDPARCSPERLAELAAHDAHIKDLEYRWGRPFLNHKSKRLI